MPLLSQLHEDKLLSNVSVRYKNPDMIAMEVFPEVPVNNETDKYRIYARNWRIPYTQRAIGGLANEHQFYVTTSSYILETHALKDYVPDDAASNYDQSDLLSDTTEELTEALNRRIEKSVADLFTTTSWSLNLSLTSTAAFNLDTTLSNPIPVFDTAASTIIANSGQMPTYGIMRRDGFIGVKNHQSILDRIKYTSSEVDKTVVSRLLGLSELHVPLATYDTSPEGVVTETVQAIWGDIAFLGFKPSRPSARVPSAGYTFRKAVAPVRRWTDNERKAQAVEVEIKFVPKVVSSLSGFLIKDIV